MGKVRSTKDFSLSSNERLNLKEKQKLVFKFTKIKNLTSKYLNFYTFHAGFKKKSNDLLIIVFKIPTPLRAIYSKTSTPSAPIIWDKKNNKGLCKVLIINSGNANAHTGLAGLKSIDNYVAEASNFFHCPKNQILVSSTGVIGEQLDIDKIKKVYPLINNKSKGNLLSAAKAIMTTDTFSKTSLKTVKIGSKQIRIFGFAKGSGMISPNMGTMLAYIFIEANISRSLLKNFLHSSLDSSFNSITVDSDTSTSDTLMLFSLFETNDKKISNSSQIKKISQGLKEVMHNLAIQIVCDGEGISKLIKVNVKGAKTYKQASRIAFSIANSPLVKTAIAGEDANWGRVIMAIGKTNEKIIQNNIKLKFGKYLVANNGRMFEKANTKKIDSYMKNKIIEINADLCLGSFSRTVYSSDLTHEYIRINADYRS